MGVFMRFNFYTKILSSLIVFCVIALAGCSGGKQAPPELVQAKNVIEYFVEPMNLHESMFSAAYPDCKPSQFAHYICSGMGTIELPLSEHAADEAEREESNAIRRPLWPNGVAMVPLTPDSTLGKQIVLRHDDARGVLIIDAYTDPSAEPVATYEMKIIKVEPSDMAKLAFGSNVELGVGY